MSVLDKLLDAVKLNDDYDEDDYLDDDLLDSDDDDFLDDDQEDKPVKKFFQKFSKKADDEEVDDFDDEEPAAEPPHQELDINQLLGKHKSVEELISEVKDVPLVQNIINGFRGRIVDVHEITEEK